MPPKLTPDFVAAAIAGLQERKKHINAHIAELRQMQRAPTRSDFSAKTAGTLAVPRKKRRFSLAARARMAEAQRKRWAALKRTQQA
jgi:hypothetical protein